MRECHYPDPASRNISSLPDELKTCAIITDNVILPQDANIDSIRNKRARYFRSQLKKNFQS